MSIDKDKAALDSLPPRPLTIHHTVIRYENDRGQGMWADTKSAGDIPLERLLNRFDRYHALAEAVRAYFAHQHKIGEDQENYWRDDAALEQACIDALAAVEAD